MLLLNIKELRRFCTKILLLNDLVKTLTDHRKKHTIPMHSLFYAMLYTTILSIKTLLARDKLLRKPFFKRFIGSKRKLVASDSSLERFLKSNLSNMQIEKINLNICDQNKDLFTEPVTKKKCGILDGTFLGFHWKEALLIPGKINLIYDFNKIIKRGKELPAAEKLLKKTKYRMGKNFLDLIIGDGLYYTQNMFSLCNNLGAHLLVKTKEKGLKVVKEAELIYRWFSKYYETETESGFDNEKKCRYKIKTVKNLKADNIDNPLQVAIVEEKCVNNKKEKFYVITDDLSLKTAELRYLAHSRWRIENNGFKEMNQLFHSKSKHIKNKRGESNLLWFMVLAYNIFHLYLNRVDLKSSILKGKSVLKDWINLLFESLIIEYSIKPEYKNTS